MGSLLPCVSAYWHLHDKQSGLLLSCLFLGSFSGTMLLSRNLRRTLRIGATAATIGLIIFATSAKSPSGFAVGICSLVMMGFGLGQLMSSINLLVGATPVLFRSRALANLGSAWCVGAVLSPLLTTVLISGASPTSRLAFFAPVFLLPVIASLNRDLPRSEDVQESGSIASGRFKRLVPLWIAIFLVYGGIEASVSGWMSMFAIRYQVSNTGYAQWLASVFWLGLIVGRLLVAGVVTQVEEKRLLSLSILSSACSLCFLVIAGSPGGLLVGIGLSGVCLGPIFPMLLSSALEYRLGSYAMGLVLAASGLGAAVFPSLLGIVSTASSLRTAMFFPPGALLLLLLMRQQSPQSEPQSSLWVG
jgi:FHS family glucose/mannose:H+ symporter-like MFS transporter